MSKFKNKYRIESNRRPGWNYASDALYFITIVTQHRVCNLGTVVQGEMVLSEIGGLVEIEWFKSFEIRQELLLDEFVIMPNHLHAIVEIWNGGVNFGPGIVETHGRVSQLYRGDQIYRGDQLYRGYQPNQPESPIKRNAPIRLPRSLSSFIGGFKSAVNSRVDDYIDANQLPIPKYNKQNHFFQPNYHDHIIRNNQEYWRIKQYIANNPKNWTNDSLGGTKA